MDRHAVEKRYQDADALFRAGDFSGALERLDLVLSEAPADKDVLYARGRCLLALGRHSEAREVAEYLINVLGAPRGKSLLHNLEEVGVSLSEPAVLPPPLARPAIPRPQAPKNLSNAVRAAALGGIAAGILAIAVVAYFATSTVREKLPDPSDQSSTVTTPQDEAAMRAQITAYRNQRATAAHAELLAAAKSPSLLPGQEIPREQWELTAIDGVPDWKPGIYRDVPCKSNAAYTINLYIPMAYQTRPANRFAGLMISMPGGNPGFQGFADYAEQVDMIIMTVNNSSNATNRFNRYAQELAFETVLPNLRIDPTLGFTYGASGGARANWDCMCRNPEGFAGLLQVVFSSGDVCPRPPRGVRVAFLYADGDFNRRGNEYLYNAMLSEGYDVRAVIYPGNHGTDPPMNMKIQLMDWLVGSARRDRGLPHPRP